MATDIAPTASPPSPQGSPTAPSPDGPGSLALGILRAAALPAPFGIDLDEAEELWNAKLGEFPLAAVLQAANIVISEAKSFPTLSEFLGTVEKQMGRLGAAVGDPLEDPKNCPECGGNLVVILIRRGAPGVGQAVESVRPCSGCRPIQWKLWRAGHFKPRDGRMCYCRDVLCRDRKRAS